MTSRRLLLVALVVVLLSATVLGALSVTKRGVGQATAAVVIALVSLTVTVAKTFYDVFVAPDAQTRRERHVRAEKRAEDAAGKVRKRLGVDGSRLVGACRSAWEKQDARALKAAAQVLADSAEAAYHDAETASDALEVLVGVVWVEALELEEEAEVFDMFKDVRPENWADDRHLRTVEEYLDKVQERLHELLGGPQ